jgi:uncharacterized protein YciI
MDFDQWSVILLCRPARPPHLDDTTSATLQDAHLAFLAKTHDEGALLAAGPTEGDPAGEVVGICVYGIPAQKARATAEKDPKVVAGVLRVVALDWSVPAGSVRFPPSRFPRSMQEVRPD